MNKVVYRISSLTIALLLVLNIYTLVWATSQTTLMPSTIINLAYFYKPPRGIDAPTVVNNFHAVILTGGDEPFRNKLKNGGFSSTIPQYFRAEAIQDPGSCTASPYKNQVAYRPGDFCSISKNHPDWFLLDKSGKRIVMTQNYYRMDPGNAGWRKFFVGRVIESQKQYGWSSLFLDNVEASLGKFSGNALPAKYKNDTAYQAAVAGFLKYLNANYSKKYNRPVFGNIIALGSDTVWFNYLQYISGAMQERWAVNWSLSSYVSASQWKSDMALAEKTQAKGKYIILVSPGNESDTNRQTFAFASYLLISKGKAAFRYSNDDTYNQVWLYDNYKLNLGKPLGARYLIGNIWKRDFTRGYVTVDPVNHAAVISASGLQIPSRVGLFRPSNETFYLKTANAIGTPSYVLTYGTSGDYPVVGDWNGDGIDTVGIYRNGVFYLRNSNTQGDADIVFAFGLPGDQPVAGDWNKDGIDTVGVYRSSTGTFYLRNNNSSGDAQLSFSLGIPGDIGLAGDWNGDGGDTVGVFRPSNGMIFLKNANTTGFADIALNYGIPGDKPVVGDWNNDGTDTIGVYRNGTFYLRNSNTVGFADIWFPFGLAGDIPVAGKWGGTR